MLEFRTLGTIDIRGEDGRRIESVLLHSKRLSLLAYLCAIHPPCLCRRDTLTALLWPEHDTAHARGALRQELSRLRRSLGPGVILGERSEAVGVDNQRVWCDVQAFQAALHGGDLASALEYWTGEFLPGVHVDGGEFERWLDVTRASLTRRAVGAARRLVEEAQNAGDLAVAIGWARRMTEVAPYEENGWQRLIGLLDASGDRAGALSAFDALALRLRVDLEVEPSPETHALVAQIRARETGSQNVAPVRGNRPNVTREQDATTLGSGPSPIRRRRWLMAGGVLSGTATVVALALLAARPWGSAPPASVVIALAPVENRTGDPRFDALAGRLTQRLTRQLVTELSFIKLVVDPKAANTTAVVSASLSRRDTLVEATARLSRVGGEVLDVSEALLLAPDPSDASIDTLVARVLASVAANYDPRLAVPPEGVPYPTPLHEAFLENARGSELFAQFRFADAAQHMLRAYQIDKRFVTAAIFGAIALVYAGQPAVADSLVTTLLERGNSLSKWDRLWCEWLLADLHGERGKAYRAIEEATHESPHPSARVVAAREALMMNRPRETTQLLKNMREGRGWWLNWTELWEVRGGAYHVRQDYRHELSAVLPGRSLFPESLDVLRAEIRARAGLGQSRDVLRLVAEALTFPPGRTTAPHPTVTTPADVAWTAAQELDAHGQPRAAAAARATGIAWLRERRNPTRADSLLQARLLLETGDVEEAQRILDQLEPLDDPGSLGLAGLIAAKRGNAARVRSILARLEASSDPYLNGRHLLHAAGVRAAWSQPESAVETLRRAFAAGLPFGVELHALPILRPLAGRSDFVTLLRARG
jgi:DNA-binding SARP family transcriptional activator